MKQLSVCVLLSAIISAGLLWAYDQKFAVKIAVIDMDGYVSRLKADYIQGKLPNDVLDADLQRLSREIKEKYSSNTILLLKEVVVSGDVPAFDPNPGSQ